MKAYLFGPMCSDIPGQEIRFKVTEDGTLVSPDLPFWIRRRCTILGWAVLLDSGRIWMGGLFDPPHDVERDTTFHLTEIVATCNFDLPDVPRDLLTSGILQLAAGRR